MDRGGGGGLVSVVLCTTGRRPSLGACLESLRALRDPAHEVLVVENNRAPRLSGADFGAWGARLVHEPRPGLDAARNRGAREAAGDILAFVDDDCVVDPDWIAGYRQAFEDPSVDFATGRVLPLSLERSSERAFEQWFSFDRGPDACSFSLDETSLPLRVLPYQLGTGCNMAFRRSILTEAGGFDEALDMGTLIGGGGDLDVFARLLASGRRAVYAPDALMHHAHRTTMRALRWQFFGYGVSQGALVAKAMLRGSPGVRSEARAAWSERTAMVAAQVMRRARRRSGFSGRLVLPELIGILLGPFVYPLARAQALTRGCSRRRSGTLDTSGTRANSWAQCPQNRPRRV